MEKKYKEPVSLRTKKLKDGSQSLYLDTYVNGVRKYEFLRLYLIPEKTRGDRDKNKETLRLANAVKAKRIVDIQDGRFGFATQKGGRTSLFEFLAGMLPESSKSTREAWLQLRLHLSNFADGRDFSLSAFDSAMVERFTEYLLTETKLKRSTIALVLSKLHHLFAVAVKRGLMQSSPFAGISRIKVEEKEREFLVLDEIRKLSDTPCLDPVTKRAFLFGCLTGLRLSDIRGLVWSDVREPRRIVFRQKKTSSQEYLDITPQARQLMGERGEPEEPVFEGLTSTSNIERHLRIWTKAAGIDRHITFHCSRHSFAVMMLDLGADIYTVSKLLGHRSLKTTQVYAHILDKNKQKAVMMIPQIL